MAPQLSVPRTLGPPAVDEHQKPASSSFTQPSRPTCQWLSHRARPSPSWPNPTWQPASPGRTRSPRTGAVSQHAGPGRPAAAPWTSSAPWPACQPAHTPDLLEAPPPSPDHAEQLARSAPPTPEITGEIAGDPLPCPHATITAPHAFKHFPETYVPGTSPRRRSCTPAPPPLRSPAVPWSCTTADMTPCYACTLADPALALPRLQESSRAHCPDSQPLRLPELLRTTTGLQ